MRFRMCLFGSGVALAAIGCGSSEEAGPAPVPASMAEARQGYATLVAATYADALKDVQALDAAIDAFLADPDADTFAEARQAWLDARESYLPSEAFRFYDGPIDDPDTGVEGLVNAWPLDESFIDYTVDDPGAGIVNDTAKEAITQESLVALNEQGGEENIATGFHAIEFLLWGQDLRADGPGERTFGDYVDAPGGLPNVDRRKRYLEVTSDLLLAHIGQVHDAWASGRSDNYRAEFEAASPAESLRRILTGLTVLSGFETGGERLQTSLDSGSQEDEHSCFSDNTHRDMVRDIAGIQNVWLGKATFTDGTTVEGTGIEDVVRETDPARADAITAQIAESLQLAEALKPPFDQEIATTNTEGRRRVSDLVTALRTQAELLEELFVLYGLAVPVIE